MKGSILALFCLVVTVFGYPDYRTRIPNGFNCPNPCGSVIWEAVGHFDPVHHTINKNKFGSDFSAAGHTWTRTLCMKDSDGDGMTNGEELGDPNCGWSIGDASPGTPQGHPGICEPVGSSKCASDSFSCGCKGNTCVG